MGISLGANILSQTLGELGQQGVAQSGAEIMDAAIVLANPFDLRLAT